MSEFQPAAWLVFLLAGAAIVLAAGVVKGAMGVGMGMLAVPMLSLFVPPAQAIGLMVVPVLWSNVVQTIERGSPIYRVKRRWCMDTAGTGVTPTPQGLRRQLLKCGRSSGVQRSACG